MNHVKTRIVARTAVAALALAAAGCGHDHDHHHDHENEVITTVLLTFTPTGGGAAITAMANDPDGDGGNPPVIEPVNLAPGMYGLTVRFENRLVNPPEDITREVRDEGAEHQVFFTGTAVSGPASNQPSAPLQHAYADMDARGLPLGLSNTITAAAGMGTLTVTLRHLPAVNRTPVKTASAAETVRMSGFAMLPGSTDAQVSFPVTVM